MTTAVFFYFVVSNAMLFRVHLYNSHSEIDILLWNVYVLTILQLTRLGTECERVQCL